MKIALQLATSVLALAGLLAQATANATNLAEQPLKASVLAKPNVVFAMDDSGSMDSEVMIDGTFQGWFWGNYNSNSILNGSALRTGSAGDDWSLFYLFPNGTGTGNKVYTDQSTYGYAIPPTLEMAWLRSSDYNPLYYNPAKTYVAWSPAYLSGATRTYTDATATAARSHPALGSTTTNLTATLTQTSADWKFTFIAGMTIPTGTTNISCYSGSAGTLPYKVTSSRMLCLGAVSYFPATYWKKETCTVNTTDCTTAWDGATIKRYEIKPANYGTTAAYNAAIQNFANWFTYYRKRRLMLAAAMGGVLETLTGARLGVVAFNNNTAPTMKDADATSAANNSLATTGVFYANEGGGGTPTHTAYAYIRNQFDTNTNIIQYACQKNAAFIITDGFANDASVTPPSYSQATYGTGTPYQSITTGSLADQALAYYTLRLRTSDMPAGKVPAGNAAVNPDINTNLHLSTYALTLGMKGTLWPARTNAFSSPAPTWPTPVSNTASMIDDLWHATVNGRGQMYLATDVDSTIVGIRSALADIISQPGAQSSVAVSTSNLLAGDGKVYEASYDPSGWTGNLVARNIDTTTGDISTSATWDGAALLNARPWTGRVIFASDGTTTGLPFTTANVGATVNPDTASFTNQGAVEYLRGNRSGEGSTYRTRNSLIGAVVNSKPAVDGTTGTVYLASSEGMLHAFNTTTGAEEWAFVPQGSLTQIGQTIQREYAFKTKLDSTPVVGWYSNTGRLLAGGMGAAGRNYYALDVTNPKSLSETAAAAQVKWTFPSPSQTAYQAKVGYTVGRPVLVKHATQGYVALVTSGYDNGYTIGDGLGRMWMLNANTGAVISEFTTTGGTTSAENGLSQLTGYLEETGLVRYVYGGDLLGNVWKFDLDTGTTTLVAVLKDSAGNRQPVTTAPQLAKINGSPLVMVGTGRMLDITDFGGSAVQSVYAFLDTVPLTSSARGSLQQLTRNVSTGDITGTIDWTTQRGWYLDLPATQVVNVDPKYVLGWLHVVANTTGGSDCSASSYAYRIKVKTAGGYSETISTTVNATEPLLVQSNNDIKRIIRKYDGTDDKRDVTDPANITSRKNAWREIVR